MATSVDIAGTNISAPQMSEFFRLAGISGSQVNRVTLQAYLEGRNPFAFERNEHGHIVVTVTGLDLTGAQEIARLEAAGYRLADFARSCLLSQRVDSYDAMHRLVAGREYKIALMPGNEIGSDSDRTTANLRKRGMGYYGYGKPFAGLVPRICETVSDKQFEEMGAWYAVALHDPIVDSDGDPGVLIAGRNDDGRRVRARWVDPGAQWSGFGVFAFPVAAS